jgi:phenylacetate-CoA ligase
MSEKYFEVSNLLRLPELGDESSENIKEIQSELISRTLRNALQNVPYYKKRVRLNPDSIKPSNAAEALLEFPLIEKQDIMNNPREFVSRNVNKYTLIYTTTGGSTGRGIALLKRYDEYQVEQAFIEDMWSKFGYNRKSRILRIGADGIVPLDKPPCQVDNRRLLVSPRHLNESWLPHIVQKADKFNVEFIHAYPSCLEILAGYLKQIGNSLTVKGIFLASEEVTPEQLEFFSEVFEAPIWFFYGASEQALLGYGCYDGKNICYHFHPLYGFVENSKDEYGYELVGTGLWNYAMPLIRYRTQDYGKIMGDVSKCSICGKSWKTVYRLDGRRQNYLTTKQGTKFPGLSVVIDKFIWDYVSNFQFVQNTPGEIELHIVPRSNYSNEIEAKVLEAQRKRLSDWFDPIRIIKDPEIPLTKAGKRRLVIVNTT